MTIRFFLLSTIYCISFAVATAQNKPFEHEPKMVLVPGGTFMMGDVLNDNENENEKPTHLVILDSFYIGKYEVSQLEWIAVMDTNPSHFIGDNLPVEQVSWEEIQVYLQKLNAKTNKNYRLPTEAEWEFAAREGGKKIRFGNGKDTIEPVTVNFNAASYFKRPYSVVGENRVKTLEVNSFPPNSLGIYNMSGNVWEWCSDLLVINPSNSTNTTPVSNRLIRGGGFGDYPQNCRTSVRGSNSPTTHYEGLGFRVVHSTK